MKSLTDEEINKIKEQKLRELEDGKREYLKRQDEKKKAGIVVAEELSEKDKKYYKRNISHGPIPEFEYVNGNGNGNGKTVKNDNLESEFDSRVQKLIQENQDISFEDWSTKLLEKRTLLNEKVNEYFPPMQLLLDFELAVKKILNIQDITLPFMGIVFAVPSSLKTAFFKFLRNLRYSYYTDKFTARIICFS